jgi:hypothetical protein
MERDEDPLGTEQGETDLEVVHDVCLGFDVEWSRLQRTRVGNQKDQMSFFLART